MAWTVSSFSVDFSGKPGIQHKPEKLQCPTSYLLLPDLPQAIAPHIAAQDCLKSQALSIIPPPVAVPQSQQRNLSGEE